MTDILTLKSLEEHRDYLYEIVKLKLWFIHHWLGLHPDETFQYVLEDRVDIYRKLDVNPESINPSAIHFDDPRWQSMAMAAEAAYHRNLDDSAAFEAEAFEIFRPSLDARCERDWQDQSEVPRYQCGCFRHNLALTAGNRLNFHIANFSQPRSFFDYPDYMKGCFKMLLDRAEFIYHAEEIGTGTWLNSVKRWQEWFPQEWLDNMAAPNMDIRWHYGYWGQFITARGTFNAKYGKYLRETGQLPFYPRSSRCTIQAMREKLNSMNF